MPAEVACPRHPATLTRLRCSRCESVICPDCMVPAATGFICGDCAKSDRASAPHVKRIGPARAGLRSTPVTAVLLTLVAAGGLLTAARGGMDLSGGLFSGGTDLHSRFGFFLFSVGHGEWWRLLTSAFLHYGPFHLAMNAYGLVILGPMLEERLGSARFALLWLVAELGSSAGSALVEPFGLAAGASGGLFGFLGAMVVLERRRGMRNLMESQVGVWLLMGLVMTFAVPGISVGGHLGGLVGGAAAGSVLFAFDRPGSRHLGVLAGSAIGILAMGIVLVAFSRTF